MTERRYVRADGVVNLSQGRGRHPDGCECQRCAGFQPGNDRALVHGARASVERLLPEAEELADQLVPLVPAYAESDRPAVLLLALTLRRIARAEAHLTAREEAEGETPENVLPLQANVRQWTNVAGRLLDALGMTPTARARLGLDLARGASVLEEYVAREYAEALPPEVVERSLDDEEADGA